MSTVRDVSGDSTVGDGRVAKALAGHALAGAPVFLVSVATGLTTVFWVSWSAVALIVAFRSSQARRAWPWTLAWFLLWLVPFVVIFIALLSWDGPCPDCGAVF